MYKSLFKRLIDLLFAFCGIIILSPLFFLIILWLYSGNRGGGVFFFQKRPGRYGKIFKVIKFKTMTDEKDQNGNLLSDEFRLTRIGKFIRSTSLDEIPQLINVLKGDMSLVGPRPLLVKYLPLYTEEQMHRHDVRPGITGWAQVNGRNELSWEKKFELDIWYVKHICFTLDMKIVFLTIRKVLRREGISSGTSITMKEFKGDN